MNDSSQPPSRLDGWKEIATYLKRGVRTAQRWEARFGLPVHRLGNEGSDVVFAFNNEIDAWMKATELRNPRALDEQPNGSTGPGPDSKEGASISAHDSPAQSSAAPLGPRSAVAALLVTLAASVWLLLAVLVPATALWARRGHDSSRGPASPVRAEVVGGILRVTDAAGRLLWSRSFAEPLSDPSYSPTIGDRETRLAVSDIDDDGEKEVLLVKQVDRGNRSIVVFNQDGSQRFDHVPGRRVRFGEEVYDAPFHATRLFLLQGQDGRTQLWVTSIHHSWFPSLLEELDPRGNVKQEYWSNGHITAVAVGGAPPGPGRRGSRQSLVVGACHNETRGASLAVFDSRDVRGSAPATTERYRCSTCPPGQPLAYLVFPQTDVLRAEGDLSSCVETIEFPATGELVVGTSVSAYPAPGSATRPHSHYSLDLETLRITKAEPPSAIVPLHARLQADGYLGHSWGEGDRQEFGSVRAWHAGRFVGLSQMPTTWPNEVPESATGPRISTGPVDRRSR